MIELRIEMKKNLKDNKEKRREERKREMFFSSCIFFVLNVGEINKTVMT